VDGQKVVEGTFQFAMLKGEWVLGPGDIHASYVRGLLVYSVSISFCTAALGYPIFWGTLCTYSSQAI